MPKNVTVTLKTTSGGPADARSEITVERPGGSADERPGGPADERPSGPAAHVLVAHSTLYRSLVNGEESGRIY